MFDHVIKVSGFVVNVGPVQQGKGWLSRQEIQVMVWWCEYENKLSCLEMKKQGKTQPIWILDDESRQSSMGLGPSLGN